MRLKLFLIINIVIVVHIKISLFRLYYLPAIRTAIATADPWLIIGRNITDMKVRRFFLN